MVRTRVTSKGQTTIPREIRKQWQSQVVTWEFCEDGSARVRPVDDLAELFGSAKSSIPKQELEKSLGRGDWGK